MDLLLQFQQDLLDKLNSESCFQNIAVAKLRDLVVSAEIARRLPHLAGKNGKLGCGILINMPAVRNVYANPQAPISEFEITIDVIENPELNFLPTGTQLTCEEVARQVRQTLSGFPLGLNLGGTSIFAPDSSPVIAPNPDISQWPGCCGYRVNMKMQARENAQSSTPSVTLTNSGDAITLSGPAGATVYYTTDGSFPGPSNSNGTAVVYSAPFTAASGTTVRYAAYLAGSLGSGVGCCVAP